MMRSIHCGESWWRSLQLAAGAWVIGVIGFSGVVSADSPAGQGPAARDAAEPRGHRSGRPARAAGRGGKARGEPPAAVEPSPPPPPVEDEDRRYSVECLLDKTKCLPREQPAAPAPEPPSPESLLPEQLEMADIAEGTRVARAAAAQRCRALARGGEVVKVKLSIAGPSGTVLSAGPEDDAGNPALAACCAEALREATFKKVRKPQIGAVATIKF